jgi:hypothetical protein
VFISFACHKCLFVHLPSASSFRSVLLFVTNVYLFIFCSPKKRTKKGRPQIFFGIPIFSVAHALQLVVLRPPQTVMLTKILRFAASKMQIVFQKISEGIDRLTAIWVKISHKRSPKIICSLDFFWLLFFIKQKK